MHNKKLKSLQALLTPLRHFALNSEATVETIAEATGKNYTTILRATRKLESLKLVKLSRLERTATKGRQKRFYALTLYGLEAYLGSGEKPFSEIREIANAHGDMLLVFKKWPKFVEARCEQDVILNLKEAVRHSLVGRYVFMPLAFGFTLTPEEESRQRRGFDAHVLGFLNLTRPPQHVKEVLKDRWDGLKRIWKVVEDDYELRQARGEFIHYLEREHSEALKSIGEWKPM